MSEWSYEGQDIRVSEKYERWPLNILMSTLGETVSYEELGSYQETLVCFESEKITFTERKEGFLESEGSQLRL